MTHNDYGDDIIYYCINPLFIVVYSFNKLPFTCVFTKLYKLHKINSNSN